MVRVGQRGTTEVVVPAPSRPKRCPYYTPRARRLPSDFPKPMRPVDMSGFRVGLHETSRIVGRNRSTLHRAMKDGRLSYSLDASGERRIDVAELERVFGSRVAVGNGAETVQSNDSQRREIEVLHRLVAEQDGTIRDLRQRLDASDDERRRLTLLLSPPPTTKTAEPDPQRPLGRRILAWLARQHGW